MSQTVAARAYRACKITDPADHVQGNSFRPHAGAFIALHSSAPPPEAEYLAYLAKAISDDPRGKRSRAFVMTAAKLRRAVIMRRSGCNSKDVATALGCSRSAANRWLAQLPEDLAA